MNFLFVIALNHTDTSHNYKSIMMLLTVLAKTMDELGHRTHVLAHTNCFMTPEAYQSATVLDVLTSDNYPTIIDKIGFKPDYAFMWNGNPPSDQITIDVLKSNGVKMVYGELGFINHYGKTCYFDLSGVNCRISNIAKPVENFISSDQHKVFEQLIIDNRKDRIELEPFIFVPLQIESDTQIVKYSPFKTMDGLLSYVSDIFVNDDRKILYKQHPHQRSVVKNYDKFVEVYDDVHHYIPYADIVVGVNSTVLTETLLYHDRIISLGAGTTSRHLKSETQRKRYLLGLYDKQLNWSDLSDKSKVEGSIFYQEIIEDYKKCKV